MEGGKEEGGALWQGKPSHVYRMIEEFQGQDADTQLLQAEEQEARTHNCQQSVLDSYSFQALGHYQKLRDGYLLSLKTINVITATLICGSSERG